MNHSLDQRLEKRAATAERVKKQNKKVVRCVRLIVNNRVVGERVLAPVYGNHQISNDIYFCSVDFYDREVKGWAKR